MDCPDCRAWNDPTSIDPLPTLHGSGDTNYDVVGEMEHYDCRICGTYYTNRKSKRVEHLEPQ